MDEKAGYALGWDDQIEKDSEFTLLQEQDCDFEVVEFGHDDIVRSPLVKAFIIESERE